MKKQSSKVCFLAGMLPNIVPLTVAENSIKVKIMCHVHITKNYLLPRGKYLPVAQVVSCQDKPKGISL